MQRSGALGAMLFGIVVLVAGGGLSSWQHSFPVAAQAIATTPNVAVGPQYDTTHVYVAPQDFDRFVASLIATFGGTTYLVTDMDVAVRAARATGADVLVAPFNDPIGRDAVIQWPGGVNTQLYWHTTAPSYASLQSVPENRVYVSTDKADEFVRSFLAFSHGRVASDDADAPGLEIGRSGETYRRVRVESQFGKLTVFITNGHLPYPYGREMTGYEVANLADTLTKAKAAGVEVIVPRYKTEERDAAVVQFPGGYIAEIHSVAKK